MTAPRHPQVTGNTPLMYAAMENKIGLMERMLELGCDPLAKNREMYSALHLASMYSREDTIKVSEMGGSEDTLTDTFATNRSSSPRELTPLHQVGHRSRLAYT